MCTELLNDVVAHENLQQARCQLIRFDRYVKHVYVVKGPEKLIDSAVIDRYLHVVVAFLCELRVQRIEASSAVERLLVLSQCKIKLED